MRKTIVGMYEAKTHFSKLVRRAAAGEEVVISSAGTPVAKLVGYTPADGPRTPGLLAGQIEIAPDFDELPPGFDEAFGGP
jgi:prevent-host-death family protein